MGNDVVWDPEQYRRGNYFQNQISESFCQRFPVELSGNILDVGCGDGRMSRWLADNLSHGRIVGIDSSEDMIRYADTHWGGRNLSFKHVPVEEFQASLTYDFVVSFWCLHWTKLTLSLPNIFQSLKSGGRFYAVFSSFSDNSILQTWQRLAEKRRYSVLTDRYRNRREDRENYFYQVVNILNQLPFRHVHINMQTTRTCFPDMDYFKNLLRTMPFMKNCPEANTEELIEDMTEAFQEICQQKYQGRLYYETRPVFLEAVKP